MFPRCIAVIALSVVLISSGNCQTYKRVLASGIKGKVLLTGNCPGPQRVGENCPSRPYQGSLAVRRASNQQVVATTKSDRYGDFSVVVPPGKYFITQAGAAKYPIIHSEEITVVKEKFTTVQLQGDLGMR